MALGNNSCGQCFLVAILLAYFGFGSLGIFLSKRILLNSDGSPNSSNEAVLFFVFGFGGTLLVVWLVPILFAWISSQGLGCTRHLPSSSWYVMEAPRRPCVGPTAAGIFSRCHHLADQCFETGAPLNRWSRVGGVRRVWPFNFDSEDACADWIYPSRINVFDQTPLFLCRELTCVRADDRAWQNRHQP